MDHVLENLPDLPAAVWQLLAQVPAGRVTTYGRLADALGDGVAARWIGHLMLHHPHTSHCACHRVVRADGQLGRYIAGDLSDKARRLGAEQVRVLHECVDLAKYGFGDFRGDRPLAALREYQQLLAGNFCSRAPRVWPRQIGAVDVSYAPNGDGVAAFALCALPDRRASSWDIAWSTTIRRPVSFPYITSYLAFRELPLYVELIGELRACDRMPDLILVDGSGILHPRQAGIATMLGIVADVATVGVTKKRLCGSVDLEGLAPGEIRQVVHSGRVAGLAVGPPTGTKKPWYVSPGHRSNVGTCRQLVAALLRGELSRTRRLPLPIDFVDRLSRRVARQPAATVAQGTEGGRPRAISDSATSPT